MGFCFFFKFRRESVGVGGWEKKKGFWGCWVFVFKEWEILRELVMLMMVG